MKNLDYWMLLSLFAGYTGKVLVLGAQPADAAVVLVLAAAHFLYNSQIQNKNIKALEDRIAGIEKQHFDQNTKINEISTVVNGIKLGASFRQAK